MDEQGVQMHIVSETGETTAVARARDLIFRVQRAIERMGANPGRFYMGDGAPDTNDLSIFRG